MNRARVEVEFCKDSSIRTKREKEGVGEYTLVREEVHERDDGVY